MSNKHSGEIEEAAGEYSTRVSQRAALRRKSLVGNSVSGAKKRRTTRGKRKNRAAGGMHLRGDKRTDR